MRVRVAVGHRGLKADLGGTSGFAPRSQSRPRWHLRGLFSQDFQIGQANAAFDRVGVDDVFNAAVVHFGQVVHQAEHDFFHDSAEGAGAGVALLGLLGDAAEGGVGEGE